MDLSAIRHHNVSKAVWSELFTSVTFDSGVIRNELELFLTGDPKRSRHETIGCILRILAENPDLAEQFKEKLVPLLSESTAVLFAEVVNVVVACRWYDQVPHLLTLMDDEARREPACRALIEFLRTANFSRDEQRQFRAQFIQKLLNLLECSTGPDQALSLWHLLLEADEFGIVPVTAFFTVVGLGSVRRDIRFVAIDRVCNWPNIGKGAPKLLAQLEGMMRDPALRWEPALGDRIAELLLRILDSEAEPQARLSALRLLLVLAKDFRGIRRRLEEYSTSRYLAIKGRHPHPWWQRLFS